MKLKINKPRSEDDRIIATSLRLNKGVWQRLQAESDATRDSEETYFISSQKMVELILKQVLEDSNFKLEVPHDLVKPPKKEKK